MSRFQNTTISYPRNNNYNQRSNLRANSRLGSARKNYNTFQEDPEKAVFLSGFRTNIHRNDWKEYREVIYQDLQKQYGVYVRKLDLPVNSKFGYLHTKTVEQAQRLLSLHNIVDQESGKTLSQLVLGMNTRNWLTKVHVYEYQRKTDNHHLDDNSSIGSNSRNVREGRVPSRRNYKNSDSIGTNSSYRSLDRLSPQSRNCSNARSQNGNSSNGGCMSSRSISPENAYNPDSGRTAPFQTPIISDDITIEKTTEKLPLPSNNSNQDSALQSGYHTQVITEPTSEDELDQINKSGSTKTVVPSESKMEDTKESINYVSDTEMSLSDNENNQKETTKMDAGAINQLQRQSSKGVNNNDVNDIINQSSQMIIYNYLKQDWCNEYNFLSDFMQQILILNYHDTLFTEGKDQAAYKLKIQGMTALELLLSGKQIL